MDKLISLIPIIFALMVAVINIITQMVKGYTYKIIPTRVLVLILGTILGIFVTAAGCDMYNITVKYYYIISGAIGGIVAGYVSMYGKDEIYTLFAETLKRAFGKE